MKYISFVFCTVIIFLGLISFTGNRAQLAPLKKSDKQKITYAQTLAAELAELARQPIRTTVEGRQEMSRMGKDSSTLQTIYDAFGNKTESRVFYNDELLKMVVVKTSAEGEKEAYAYGQNGDVKIVPQNLLDKALIASAGEIAKSVEIFEGRQENELIVKLNAPQIATTEEFPIISSEQTAVEGIVPTVEAAPEQVENQTETVETKEVEVEKTETPTVKTEVSALQLRAAVQSLKAVKKVNRNVSSEQMTAKAN